MSRKMMMIGAVALVAFSTLAPLTSAPADARDKTAKIAAGVIIGAAALAIIANSAQAQGSSKKAKSNSRASFWKTCKRWYNDCTENGNDHACEKYETRGCTE